MGHVRVACTSCHGQLRQTVFFEPPHDRGTGRSPAGDRTGSPALSPPATTAGATATAEGRPRTTQLVSPAVCALTTLAFLPGAARLAATAKAAGPEDGRHPRRLAR